MKVLKILNFIVQYMIYPLHLVHKVNYQDTKRNVNQFQAKLPIFPSHQSPLVHYLHGNLGPVSCTSRNKFRALFMCQNSLCVLRRERFRTSNFTISSPLNHENILKKSAF